MFILLNLNRIYLRKLEGGEHPSIQRAHAFLASQCWWGGADHEMDYEGITLVGYEFGRERLTQQIVSKNGYDLGSMLNMLERYHIEAKKSRKTGSDI